jgi:hypothetical protein
MKNKTYYVNCSGDVALRDSLLDYAVERGAKHNGSWHWKEAAAVGFPHAVLEGDSAVRCDNNVKRATPITPATWKRKVRKIWGGAKTKKAVAKKTTKTIVDPLAERMEAMYSDIMKRLAWIRDGVDSNTSRIANAKDRLCEVEATLSKLESSVAVIRSGATFMQQLEKDAPQGLQSGDYCDASKEVADALTAMGWKWCDGDRAQRPFIRIKKDLAALNFDEWRTDYEHTHLAPAEFLSRAAVTAKELGLQPVVEEPLKAGDWFVCDKKPDDANKGTPGWSHNMNNLIGKVLQVSPESAISKNSVVSEPQDDDEDQWEWKRHWIRPATDLEVTAYYAAKKEQERKEKEARMSLGLRVQTPDGVGAYWFHNTSQGHKVVFSKGQVGTFTIDDITIID